MLITKKPKLFYIIASILLAGVFVGYALAVNYVSDDGFISFRYARNLIQGHGLVYNPGERVEGYTGFLWVILLAGMQWLLPSVRMLHIAQALGLSFSVLTILLVCHFSWRARKDFKPFGLLAGAFLTVHSGFAAWATGGLETSLFALLVFAGTYVYVAYLQTGKYFLAVPGVFALAALTRPDGLLFFGVTTLFAIFIELRRGEKRFLHRILAWGLIFTAIYGPYYVWRFVYYGYPLPNTYYAKVGLTAIAQFRRGARYLWNYLTVYGVFVFIPTGLLLLRKNRESWIDYLILLIGAYVLYLVYIGGDGLAFYRFLTYIAPLMYLLVQEGFVELNRRGSQLPFVPTGRKMAVPALVLVIISLWFTTRQTARPLIWPVSYRWFNPQSELYFPVTSGDHTYYWFDNYFVDRLEVAARWLEVNAPPNAVVASTPAGSIGYHMNLNVIDMLGLNDVHIAHAEVSGIGTGRAGHEKGDGRYILSRSPDFILMGNVAVLPRPLDEETMARKLVQKSEHELWVLPEFHDNYELACAKLGGEDLFRYFTFYKKKGTTLPPFVACN